MLTVKQKINSCMNDVSNLSIITSSALKDKNEPMVLNSWKSDPLGSEHQNKIRTIHKLEYK